MLKGVVATLSYLGLTTFEPQSQSTAGSCARSCASAFRDRIAVCLGEFAAAFYTHKHQVTDVMGPPIISKGVQGAKSKILKSCCRKMTMIYVQGLRVVDQY